jgi:hypothetical protein
MYPVGELNHFYIAIFSIQSVLTLLLKELCMLEYVYVFLCVYHQIHTHVQFSAIEASPPLKVIRNGYLHPLDWILS